MVITAPVIAYLLYWYLRYRQALKRIIRADSNYHKMIETAFKVLYTEKGKDRWLI